MQMRGLEAGRFCLKETEIMTEGTPNEKEKKKKKNALAHPISPLADKHLCSNTRFTCRGGSCIRYEFG